MEENNNFQQNLNYPISKQNIKGNENKKLITKKAFPINCRICGGVASGYIYYGVMCCDGLFLNKFKKKNIYLFFRL